MHYDRSLLILKITVMKKQLLFILGLFISMISEAQDTIIYVSSPGTLLTEINPQKLLSVKNLTINGTLDARDFNQLDQFLAKDSVLNLSGVSIAAYTGLNGTADSLNQVNPITYEANRIPDYAFCVTLYGMPAGTTFYPSSRLIILPESTTAIGKYAFNNCNSLLSVTIPASVNTIGTKAFGGCKKLHTIYCYANSPIDLSLSPNVFEGVDTVNCILYVPQGSKLAYQSAYQWKAFINIVEIMPTSINSIFDMKPLLYPNPAKESFYINSEGVSVIEIYALNGTLIMSKSINGKESIATNNLPTGMYIVKISNKNILNTERIIIK